MLLLFDIDGTLLLRAADAHRDAIYEALRVVHGVTEPERRGMEVAGRTDADISRSLLVHAGVSAEQIDERADDVRVAACAAYGRLCPPDLSGTSRPGCPSCSRGSPRARTRCSRSSPATTSRSPGSSCAGPASGTSSPPARAASAPTTRTARCCPGSRAAAPARPAASTWPQARTAVIGDTPRDIACARADGVRVAAIATGPFAPAELTAADAVARDAAELGANWSAGCGRRLDD